MKFSRTKSQQLKVEKILKFLSPYKIVRCQNFGKGIFGKSGKRFLAKIPKSSFHIFAFLRQLGLFSWLQKQKKFHIFTSNTEQDFWFIEIFGYEILRKYLIWRLGKLFYGEQTGWFVWVKLGKIGFRIFQIVRKKSQSSIAVFRFCNQKKFKIQFQKSDLLVGLFRLKISQFYFKHSKILKNILGHLKSSESEKCDENGKIL